MKKIIPLQPETYAELETAVWELFLIVFLVSTAGLIITYFLWKLGMIIPHQAWVCTAYIFTAFVASNLLTCFLDICYANPRRDAA